MYFINEGLIILIILYIYLQNFGQILNSIDRAELNLKKYNLYTFAVNTISIILFLFICKNNDSITSYFLSYVISYIIINNIFYSILIKSTNKTDTNINFDIKALIWYGLPLVAINISGILLSIGDRFVLNIFNSSNDVGIYSGIYSITNGIWSLMFMVISSYVYPIYMKLYKKQGKEKVTQFLSLVNNIMINIAIGAMFFISIFNEFIVKLFLSNEYIGNYTLIILLFSGNILYGIYYLTSSEYYINKNTKVLMKGMLFIGLMNTILNIITIPIMGINGAAFSTIISYITLVIITYKKQTIMEFRIYKGTFIKNITILITIAIVTENLIVKNIYSFLTMLVIYILLFGICNRKLIKLGLRIEI